jgi:hypothetical protein
MHDGIGVGDELGHQLRVGHIALHQPDAVLDWGQRLTAAGIGQGVEHGHRVLARRAMHEVGADEPGAAGDQQSHG